MKRRRVDAVKNVVQRVRDERTKKIMAVATKVYPDIVYDFDKLVRTHSCKAKNQADLLERAIAIVASYLLGADRKYLHDVAFSAVPIDLSFGKKKSFHVTLTKVEPKEAGWMVYWEEWGLDTGTLLRPADDGYVPKVGDEAYFYTVQYSVLLGRVVNGHVFSYKTIEQYDQNRLEY